MALAGWPAACPKNFAAGRGGSSPAFIERRELSLRPCRGFSPALAAARAPHKGGGGRHAEAERRRGGKYAPDSAAAGRAGGSPAAIRSEARPLRRGLARSRRF